MKSKHFLSFLVVALLLVSALSITAFADNSAASPDIEYGDIFSKLGTTDGAGAEDLAILLVQAYDQDNRGFISALAQLSEQKLQDAVNLLVYGKSYFDMSEFKSSLEQLLANEGISDAEVAVISAIQGEVAGIVGVYTGPIIENTLPPAPAFRAKTILHFIEVHEQLGTVSEGYFNTLGTAFRADPNYFAEVIGELPSDTVNYITKAVIYDCKKNAPNFKVSATATYSANNLVSQVADALANDSFVVSLDDFYTESALAEIHAVETEATNIGSELDSIVRASSVPSVSMEDYSANEYEVGKIEILTVTFSESRDTTSSRTYWTECYIVRNGKEYLEDSKYVTIQKSATNISAKYVVNFSEVGEVYTLIKVYTTRNGSLLTSKKSPSAITITGEWNIDVVLPKDRNTKGTLALYNATGIRSMSCECLGRSVRGYDTMITFGNTPTGVYNGYLDGPSTNTSSYGPYKYVYTYGVSGEIIDSGRTGIWIHGGDPADEVDPRWPQAYPLRPTEGCVRVSNTNQRSIQTILEGLTASYGYHDPVGVIEISQR